MSRTHRKEHYNKAALRRPKTQQEIKQLNHMLEDIQDEDYDVSGLNRIHGRLQDLPTAWDDKVISAYYEMPPQTDT